MTLRNRRAFASALFAALLPSPTFATSSTPGQVPPPEVAALQKAAWTFPQGVRAGDLAGRYLLVPTEAQHVLGRVASPALLSTADGTLMMVVHRRGFFGLGGSTVALPIDDFALLGEHVVLVGRSPDAFTSLPSDALEGSSEVPANQIVRFGIVGPFH